LLTISALLIGNVDAQTDREFYYGDIPLDPEVYESLLREPPDTALDGLPVAYDARDEGLVTPAKDQGACGSCWAFAVTGAMESHLLKEMGVGPEDFAEQQQVSCNSSMWGCAGGNSSALRFWEAGSYGPIDEAGMPYTARDSTPCEYGCLEQDYHVTNYHTVPNSTAAFKESLYNFGPSYWRYDVYSDFGSFWSAGRPGQVYVNASGWREGGHAVLLIGWDDAKGAFLCKNSWGATGGPNGDGTFWIAYSGHANDLSFGMANFELSGGGSGYDIELGFCDTSGGHYCDGISLNIVDDHVSVEGVSTGCTAGTMAGPLTMSLWPFGSGVSLVAAFNPDHEYAANRSSFELSFGQYPLWRLISGDGTIRNWGVLCEPPEGDTLHHADSTDAGSARPSTDTVLP
jgi:hypothetical protein